MSEIQRKPEWYQKPDILIISENLLQEIIEPGKVMREVSLTAKGSKELVDFAVKHHIQYIHFDAGWYGYENIVGSDATKVNVDPRRNPNSDLDLKEVIRYANEKGVGVFLYVNQRALYRQLDELLPLYREWGVKGIKFGFVHVGSQHWTTWMHDAVKKCAKYHLMVDIHDEYRTTGFSRTYPNLLKGLDGEPDNFDLLYAVFVFYARQNNLAKASLYLGKLRNYYPDNQQLLEISNNFQKQN